MTTQHKQQTRIGYSLSSLQAFEKCEAAGFNLSYKSLTSFEAREELRQLKEKEPELWHELTRFDQSKDLPASGSSVQEDEEVSDEGEDELDMARLRRRFHERKTEKQESSKKMGRKVRS